MILGFSTVFSKGKGSLSGRLTMFPERIWKGIYLKNIDKGVSEFLKYRDKSNYIIDGEYSGSPKLHTMREDKNNRWKVGMKIHFTIGVRTKNMFRFAPILEVKSIQRISIFKVANVFTPYTIKSKGSCYQIEIDGRCLNPKQIIVFSKNDGFDSVDDFFEWFSEDWSGKLIHWTDLKY